MIKEEVVEVPKAWGREKIIVNNAKYCGKLLYLNQGAESSYHKHERKQETFFALEGQVALTIEGRSYMLNPFSRPKTIMPGEFHCFRGITDATIIEFSTHDSPEDTFRLTESKGVVKGGVDKQGEI